jgi:hypothetical protein
MKCKLSVCLLTSNMKQSAKTYLLSECFSVRILPCPSVSLNISANICVSKSIGALPGLLVSLCIARFKIQLFCCLHMAYEDKEILRRLQWINVACMKGIKSCLKSGKTDCAVRLLEHSHCHLCVVTQSSLLLVEKHRLRNFPYRVLRGFGERWHETGEEFTLMNFLMYNSNRILIGLPNKE